MRLLRLFLLFGCGLSGSCESGKETPSEKALVHVNEEKHLLQEKAALGKQLFFDKRLSMDGSISCASCHNPKLAFCDNLPTSVGIKNGQNLRNAPSILNAAFLKKSMFDANIESLELQALIPIQEKTEMGHDMKNLVPLLRAVPEYQEKAKQLFNRDFDAYVLTRALAAFERTLFSLNSSYDQFMAGDSSALTETQQKGMNLFMNQLHCIACHPPPNFTTYQAENNGFSYRLNQDPGRFRATEDSLDIGKFKIPSLRNIALTFPYMHNGRLKSLEEVVNHYMSGGADDVNKNKLIKPFKLNREEKYQLIEFLNSLTDTSYLKKDFIVFD